MFLSCFSCTTFCIRNRTISAKNNFFASSVTSSPVATCQLACRLLFRQLVRVREKSCSCFLCYKQEAVEEHALHNVFYAASLYAILLASCQIHQIKFLPVIQSGYDHWEIDTLHDSLTCFVLSATRLLHHLRLFACYMPEQ